MKQLHARKGDARSRKCTTEFYLRHFVITRSQDTQEIKASTDKLPKKGGQFLLIKRGREREGDRQRKPQEVEESQQRDEVACLKFAIKVSHRQTRTCVSFVFMHHAPTPQRPSLSGSAIKPDEQWQTANV